MEIDPNRWKFIRTDGNRSEQINENRSEQKMEIGPNKWKSIRTKNGNRPEQMEIDPNKWKSVRPNRSDPKKMRIENRMTMNHDGTNCYCYRPPAAPPRVPP
jgi:hypothetical protein